MKKNNLVSVLSIIVLIVFFVLDQYVFDFPDIVYIVIIALAAILVIAGFIIQKKNKN